MINTDVTLEELNTMDVYERTNEEEFASIYIYNRLEYLNAMNEDSIKEILDEYSCSSISEACAVFYDTTVKDTLLQLKSYANEY